MYHTTKQSIILLSCIATFLSISPVVLAQTAQQPITQVLSVSPVILDVPLLNKKRSYPISVTNLLPVALGIHADIQGFSADDEDNGIGTGSITPLTHWSSLNTNDIIIPPNGQKTISLTLSPMQLTNGGYYEILFLTPFYSKPVSVSSPTVLSKIGVLVLATKGTINYSDLKQKVIISTFQFFPHVTDHYPLSPTIRITNRYFTHFLARPSITLTPLLGGRSQTWQLQDKHILPGKTRRWLESITPQTKSWIYKAHLVISVGNGEQLSKDTYVVVFPWLSLVSYLVPILALILVWTVRKRILKAAKILLGK